MNGPSFVPQDVIDKQIAASNPDVSAWVSANAGSGKTHVLVQRVIRLLLDGVDPSKILCLTFTKAAAANMATRVFDTLAKWTVLDDAALDAAVATIEGRRPNARRRQRARRLFAEALETPGGLKVQTIHAFATGLLHQFPFEADVAARFEVMEEHAATELIDRLRLEVLQEAADQREGPLGKALTAAIVAAADVTFADVVREAIAERDTLDAWIARAGSVEGALADLSRSLGITPDDTLERVEADFFASPHFPLSAWPVAMTALAAGTPNDQDHVSRLREAQRGSGLTRINAYLEIFCTGKLERRARVVTKAFENKHPALADALSREQTRACELLQRLRAVRLRERTAALVRIAHAVLSRYRAEKERAGLLDYDDLIDKTLMLLSREGSASWVMYKLDLGIDHVLIDEAQDTSPKQWDVIEKLTAEFTAGAGARGSVKRSIFAVGDEKQSIYSFQGAAPHRFDEMRRHFETRHNESGMAFEEVQFRASFRSVPNVLGAVDEVFKRPEAYRGLTADPVPTVHEAVRAQAPGCVDIWPLEKPDEKPEMEAWDAPFDTTSERHPRAKLAQRIAPTVRLWIERGDIVAATGAPMRPGDVLILVRQRGPLFEAIIRALKDADVDVAGADRLILTEHIAVMDLMSLADALLLPEHDLALAEALKSPLFGFDDEKLFALAHERKGSLRTALKEKAAEDPAFADAAATLDWLAASAQSEKPFAFYARLLGPRGGRRKMLARLGPEAADALDEFLALALDYERRQTPSLQGFLGWLRASAPEVKRDMDIVRDEVRVMTVHGAKGLEAPVVILADTVTKPEGPRDPALLTLAAPPQGPPLVWGSARINDVPVVAEARTAARRAADEEHRRLLYVAMTRAADRLIVCGARGPNRPPEGCWYQLVDDALGKDAVKVPAELVEGEISRWQKSIASATDAVAAAAIQSDTTPPRVALPAWLGRDVTPPAASAIKISPSAATEGEASARRTGRARTPAQIQAAMQRGRLVHRLLQSLPDVAAERHEETARRVLARAEPRLEPALVDEITAETLSILRNLAFAPLFAPGSRAEVPIVGRVVVGNGRPPFVVSGQIDRLAAGPEEILIGDFKTDRSPPARPEDVPPAYRHQLALYRAVLAQLYPNHAIRAAVVFTQTPHLVELPATLMDAALAGLAERPLDPPSRRT